jgi:hypothetical protein
MIYNCRNQLSFDSGALVFQLLRSISVIRLSDSTEIGMMFDICKASGLPGRMGKTLFSSFKAAGGAWGKRYGMAFGL